MQIELNDPELQRFVAEEVSAGRYPTADALLEIAVRRMMQTSAAKAVPADPGAPEHLKADSGEDVLELVPEGLASPAREMARSDFEQMREDLMRRYAQSHAG